MRTSSITFVLIALFASVLAAPLDTRDHSACSCAGTETTNVPTTNPATKGVADPSTGPVPLTSAPVDQTIPSNSNPTVIANSTAPLDSTGSVNSTAPANSTDSSQAPQSLDDLTPYQQSLLTKSLLKNAKAY